MDEIKESRWIDTNYILEIETMFVNAHTGQVVPCRNKEGGHILFDFLFPYKQKKLGTFFRV